jgi:accessory gene regulator B
MSSRNHNLHNGRQTPEALREIKIAYGKTVLLCEVPKLILLVGIFWALGKGTEFLFVMAVLMPVRMFSGGLHFSTNVRCFVFSLGFFLLAVCVLPMVPLPMAGGFVLLGVSAVAVAVCSPVVSQKGPLQTRARKLFLKRFACGCIMVAFAVLCAVGACGEAMYFKVGTWALVLQAAQLVVPVTVSWAKARFAKVKAECNEGLQN